MLFAFGQNNINSPYTRYGYGKLADQSYGQNMSMGGIGYGMRTGGQINPLNPASYSLVDSLTFLFDFGLMAEMSRISDGTASRRDYDGNILYLSMQFRLMKRLGMSVGLKPYSNIGYNYGEPDIVGDTYGLYQYQGSGGLTQIYGGLGYELIKNRLSLGFNFGYIFGDLDRNIYLTFPESASTSVGTQSRGYPVTQVARIEAHSIFYEGGIQYTRPIGKKDQLTVGAVFSPKQKFSSDNTCTRTIYDSKTTGSSSNPTVILSKDSTSGQTLYMPLSLGVGFSYIKNNKLTLGADVLYQAWSDVPYPAENYTFNDRMKYAVGVEYVPNQFIQRGFWKRIRYRAGAYYSNSYFDVKDSGINEYGATAGVGLPFRIRGRESMLNIGAEYLKIVPGKNLINEQHFRITVGMTFCETWFHKRKFD
ncbi:MAG: hypothetical protein FWF54_01045 [Candidatus Azobacteroides sp.]|nr:hypothetical protein [Candidatus Azobacteroides sp.]